MINVDSPTQTYTKTYKIADVQADDEIFFFLLKPVL